MSNRQWKIGDWCEHSQSRYLVFDVDAVDSSPKLVTRLGCVWSPTLIEPTYLPNCTGWDWQPPKPIEPPDGYRLLADYEVVIEGDKYWHNTEGLWLLCVTTIGKTPFQNRDQHPRLVYARKIEPQYRPFANAAEFMPHRDKYVKIKHGTTLACIHGYSDSGILLLDVNASFQKAFDRYVFEDGTPFGILDDAKPSGSGSK